MQSASSTSVSILPVLEVSPPPVGARNAAPSTPFGALVAPPDSNDAPRQASDPLVGCSACPSDDESQPDVTADDSQPVESVDGSRPAEARDDDEQTDQGEQPPDSETELIAASLAGTVAAASPTPPEAAAQSTDAERTEILPAEPAATAEAAPIAAVGEAAVNLPAAEESSRGDGKPSAVVMDHTGQSLETAASNELHPLADELTGSDIDKAHAGLKVFRFTTADNSERLNEDETGSVEASFQSAAEAVPSETAPQAEAPPNSAELAPLAANPDVRIQAPEATAPAQPAASGIDAAGNHSPWRLPAAVIAPDPSGTRPAATIDSVRLLHRVARALTAAQQRDGEIQLRLSPPELGSLRLHVQLAEGALVARLEAETSAARTVLLDNLPALRERLAAQGLRIERFDVDLMQRQGSGMPDRPQDREGHPPQQPRVAVSKPAATTAAASRPSVPRTVGPGRLNVVV